MKYEAKQAIYLPITDYLNLEFFLMDNRPGIKPEPFVVELVKSDDEKSLTPSCSPTAMQKAAMPGASFGCVFLATIIGSAPATTEFILKTWRESSLKPRWLRSNVVYSGSGPSNLVENFRRTGDSSLNDRAPLPFLDSIRLNTRDIDQIRLRREKRDRDLCT